MNRAEAEDGVRRIREDALRQLDELARKISALTKDT